ncbi:hypothetical protein ACFQ5J_12265 [Lacticaseibacillus baoqingensis]|uniref:DUF5067 domain-containing protein n=1 Tax=Lacticaseibacillus baoqingensis TaxID=2486013 RepID=A0ABW4E9F0_9LACO|nr:hypothetical protein [Lacticaseibacillus baoqingensis]
MFKKLSIICFLAVVLVGCGAHRTSNAEKLQQARVSKSSAVASSREKKKETVKITSQTVYYHQLTKADRDKVTFAFQGISDTTKAESGQVYTVPSPYSVDMQVTNKSNKTIKLDESKIVWLAIGQNVDPTTSDKEKILTVKPNKTQNVVGLFSDFNGQNFVDAGAFCYLNSDFKLAYSYLAYKDGGVTSKNLTDKKLIAMNTPSATNDEASQTSSSDDTSDSSQTQTSSAQQLTPPQLALIAYVIYHCGQANPDANKVSQVLSEFQNGATYYAADSATQGHVSGGQAASYSQYTVTGDQIKIEHPSVDSNGSDGWVGQLNLSDAYNLLFVQNAAQAQTALSNMQPE